MAEFARFDKKSKPARGETNGFVRYSPPRPKPTDTRMVRTARDLLCDKITALRFVARRTTWSCARAQPEKRGKERQNKESCVTATPGQLRRPPMVRTLVRSLLVSVPLLLFAVLFFTCTVSAHDSWVNNGGFRNSAGEWCCGDYDCKSYTQTKSTASGWMIDGEMVPFDEAMPVAPPDGQLTICRRADGTRRCVFGLKPSL
jgi:hypothetical protein